MESLEQIGIKAKKASRYLAKLGIDEKNKALEAVADALVSNAEYIIAANEKDLVNAKTNGMKPALIPSAIALILLTSSVSLSIRAGFIPLVLPFTRSLSKFT